MKPLFTGKVERGILKPSDNKSYSTHLNTLEGKEVSISVSKKRKASGRSNPQNRYYWGVVIPVLANELGYSTEEMHDAIKTQFLGEVKPITRERMTLEGTETFETNIFIPRSTTSLDTSDFEKFMSQVRQWASIELAIYIPEPNETEFDYDTSTI